MAEFFEQIQEVEEPIKEVDITEEMPQPELGPGPDQGPGPKDKAKKLYKNLQSKFRYTTEQLGTEDDFIKAISQTETATKIYNNLLKNPELNTDLLGTSDEFLGTFVEKKSPVAPTPTATTTTSMPAPGQAVSGKPIPLESGDGKLKSGEFIRSKRKDLEGQFLKIIDFPGKDYATVEDKSGKKYDLKIDEIDLTPYYRKEVEGEPVKPSPNENPLVALLDAKNNAEKDIVNAYSIKSIELKENSEKAKSDITKSIQDEYGLSDIDQSDLYNDIKEVRPLLNQIREENPEDYRAKTDTYIDLYINDRPKYEQAIAADKLAYYWLKDGKEPLNWDPNDIQSLKRVGEVIDKYEGKYKNKLKENLLVISAPAFAQDFTLKKEKGIDPYADDPRKEYLNDYQLLGLDYITAGDPESAKSYENLFVDKNYRKYAESENYMNLPENFRNILLGYGYKASMLEKIGLGIVLNNLQQQYSINPDQETAQKIQELSNEYNKISTKYPVYEDIVSAKAARVLTDNFINPWYMRFPAKVGQEAENTLRGIATIVLEPWMDSEENKLYQLEAMGDVITKDYKMAQPDYTKQTITEKLRVEPELEIEIRNIKNDKSKTENEKTKAVFDLLKENPEKYAFVPTNKKNINLFSTFYAVSDLIATILPYLAMEAFIGAATGGTSIAVSVTRRLATGFTAAFMTSYQANYEAALMQNKPNPYKEAMITTAITSAGMAGAMSVPAVRQILGKSTAVGIMIDKMDDKSIQIILDNALKTGKVKKIFEATAYSIGRGIIAGAEFESIMTIPKIALMEREGQEWSAGELVYDAAIGTLNFAVLGLNPFGIRGEYKKLNDVQLSALYKASYDPAPFLKAAQSSLDKKVITKDQYNEIVGNINLAVEAGKNIKYVDDNNQKLSENKKGRRLAAEMQKLKLEQEKINAPEEVNKKANEEIKNVNEEIKVETSTDLAIGDIVKTTDGTLVRIVDINPELPDALKGKYEKPFAVEKVGEKGAGIEIVSLKDLQTIEKKTEPSKEEQKAEEVKPEEITAEEVKPEEITKEKEKDKEIKLPKEAKEVKEEVKQALPEEKKEEPTISEVSKQQTTETYNLLNEGDKIRKEGKYIKDGIEYVRNEKGLGQKSEKGGEVRFTSEPGGGGVSVPFRYKLIEAETLQPSHQDGIRNPSHFIWEAQPKNRNDAGSLQAEESFANNPRFNEMGESTNAYSGAPVVNERNEVIQGNNRSAGIKKGYNRKNEIYKKALAENAEKFGFTKEQVDGMKEPVLVREVATSDAGAIELGNYDVKDLESGGKRRLDPIAITRRIPFDIKGRISDLLFKGEETLAQAIRLNSKRLMEILSPYINQAQRNTILKNGELTEAGMRDLESVFQNFLFEGGDVALPELFENLSHTQKEGLKKSLPYIFSTNLEKSIIPEVQEAMIALNDFGASRAGDFSSWLSQTDMFNEGMTPKDKYSATAIKIAEILNGAKTQKEISSKFAEYANEVNEKPATMFEEAKEGKSKKEGIKEIFKTEYDESKKPAVGPVSGKEVLGGKEKKPEPAPSRAKPKEPRAEKPEPAAKPEKPAEKTDLEKAKEERRAAKKRLDEIRKRLGISKDSKEEIEALFEYHKALVKEAKEYIKLGIKTVEEWAKEIGEKVNVALQTAWGEASGKIEITKPEELKYESKDLEDIRGIRIKDNEQRRQELGMAPRETNPESFEKWDAEAEKLISEGYNIENLIAKMERGEATNPVENSLRKIFAATIDAELIRNPTPEVQRLARRFVEASDVASSQAGKQLVSLKNNAEPLSTFTDFVVAKQEANGVDILTEKELAGVRERFEIVQAEKEKYEKLYNEAQAEIAKRDAQKELNKIKKINKKGKIDYAAERKNLVEKLKDQFNKYIESTKKLGISSDGGAEGFAITVDMAKTIMEIVKTHVGEIGANLSDVTKRTVADIKDIFIGITENDVIDVIAGKYSNKKPTFSQLQADLKDLKSEAKLLKELERVMAGEPKNEREQKQKNQRLFQLKAEIDKIKREKGLDQYSNEEKVKKLIKQNLKKEEEIKDKIATNDFEPEKKPLSPYDDVELQKSNPELYQELLDSRNRKSVARQLLKEIQSKKTKTLDPFEEKVKRLIEQNLKKEQEIRDRIARKDFEPEKKPLSPYDDVEFKKSNPKLYKELLDSYNRKNDARHEFELDLLKDAQARMTKSQKLFQLGEKLVNTTKKIVTGIDDSFIFMQTLRAMLKRPAIGAKAFAAHLRDFASKKLYERSLAEIHNSELYPLMQKSELDITEPKTLTQKAKEEAYSGQTFDFYITIKGKEYKILGSLLEPFERAATSLGNNMRVLAFEKLAYKYMKEGHTFENNPQLFKNMARMLNTETGRGKLNEAIEKYSKLVTVGIWSPRLMASRMDLLGLTDFLSFLPGTKGYYRELWKSPQLRKDVLLDFIQFSTTVYAMSYLLAYTFGGDIDNDPSSPGFMDVRIGDKRYNLSGGFAQYIKLMVQSYKGGSTIDGKFKEFEGVKDRGSNVLHFLRGKLTPVSQVSTDIFVGEDYLRRPVTVESEIKKLYVPLSLQNLTTDMERDGVSSLFTGTLPSFIGIGVKDKRDFNITTDLYTTDEEKKNESLKILTEKGIEIPKLGYKKSIKIRIDEKHPEGVMNDEEYEALKKLVHDKLIDKINEIYNKTYTIKEFDEEEGKDVEVEEGVFGSDLPAETLKSKIESAKEMVVNEALEELGLKRPKRKPTAEEEK